MNDLNEYNKLLNQLKNYTYIKHELDELEPLMQEEQRICLLPIKHPDIWALQEKQLSSFWLHTEIDFSKDLNDWNTKVDVLY
jgi:ribonucleoside-diphosphate reductase subunit M2